MSGLFRPLGRLLGFSRLQHHDGISATKLFHNAVARDLTRFAEGDRVLVDGSKLTFPLARNAKFGLSKGQLQFNDIIGKPVTSTYVRSSAGSLHRVELPSLEEYVTLAPRLVTPVYSSYASTIVSLLDIHPEPFIEEHSTDDTSPRIEILEAGTGHGSLTLHLARAIAAANPSPPTAELPKSRIYGDPNAFTASSPAELDCSETPTVTATATLTQTWSQWKSSRRAVIHTIEAVPAYSTHAEKIVRGFRRGIYWPHVDFHTSSLQDWLVQHSHGETSPAEYLDYVCLDMPGVHEQLGHVTPAMKDNGRLLVFVPSITQIAECVRVIAEEGLSLEMGKVLELGEGISSGRKWDVRIVKPRKGSASLVTGEEKKDGIEPEPVAVESPGGEPDASDSDNICEPENTNEAAPDEEVENLPLPLPTSKDPSPVMICRPLVGERTFGGGFIALFKKISPASAAMAAEWRQSQTGRAKKRNR
jgi:tRNA A58 N-methylase Trm61